MFEAERRRIHLAEFRQTTAELQQAIDERISWLNADESVDGEDIMARLIAEIDTQRPSPGAR